MAQQNIVDQVHNAGKQKILFLPHAIRQMAHPERVITRSEVEGVIFGGTLIEDYPEDARGHSCLIGGPRPDPQYWSTPLRRKS